MASPMLEPEDYVDDSYYESHEERHRSSCRDKPPRQPHSRELHDDPRSKVYVERGGEWWYSTTYRKYVWIPDYDEPPPDTAAADGFWMYSIDPEIRGMVWIPVSHGDAATRTAMRGTKDTAYRASRGVTQVGSDAVGSTGRVVEDIITLHPLDALRDAGMGSARITDDVLRTGYEVPESALMTTARTARVGAGAKEVAFLEEPADNADKSNMAGSKEISPLDKAIFEQHMFGFSETQVPHAGAKENDSAADTQAEEMVKMSGAQLPAYVPMDCPRAADCLGCGTCIPKSGDKMDSAAPQKRACMCAVCTRVRAAKAKMAEGIVSPTLECASVTQGEEQTKVCVSKKLFGHERDRRVRLIRVDDRFYGGDSGELGKRVTLTAKGDEGAHAGGWFSSSVKCSSPDHKGDITCYSEKRFGKNPDKRHIVVRDEDGNVVDRGETVVVRAEGSHAYGHRPKHGDHYRRSYARHGYAKHGKKGYACKSAAAQHRSGCTCPSCADCGCGCKGYPVGAPPAHYSGNKHVMTPEDYEHVLPRHYYDPPLSGGRAQCCEVVLTNQPSCECGTTVRVERAKAGAQASDPRARYYNPPLSGGRCVYCSAAPTMGSDCACAQTLYDPPSA